MNEWIYGCVTKTILWKCQEQQKVILDIVQEKNDNSRESW